MIFSDEQENQLQGIKNLLTVSKSENANMSLPPVQSSKQNPDRHKFYKTILYISTILFPIIGSYLQHYLYVIYLFFKGKSKPKLEIAEDFAEE